MNRSELIARIRELEVLVETRSTDGLTGAWNRAAIRDALAAESIRAQRTGVPLSIILADLDGLKAINDEKGHNAGDSALVRFVSTVKASIRRYDAIGRWGGDEFVIVLPGVDDRGAESVAARIRRALGNGGISASFGVAQVDANGADAAIGRADASLYETKRSGRSGAKE